VNTTRRNRWERSRRLNHQRSNPRQINRQGGSILRGNHRPASIRRRSRLPASIRQGNRPPANTRRGNRLPDSIRRGNPLPASTRRGNSPPASIRRGNRPPASTRRDRRRRDSIPAVNIQGSPRPIQVRATLPNLRRSTRVRIPAIRIVRGVHRRFIRIAVPTIVRVAIHIRLARGTKSMIRASAHRRPAAGSHGPNCRARVDPRIPTARATSGIAATARACAYPASRARD
jgi:hypothetical protein